MYSNILIMILKIASRELILKKVYIAMYSIPADIMKLMILSRNLAMRHVNSQPFLSM